MRYYLVKITRKNETKRFKAFTTLSAAKHYLWQRRYLDLGMERKDKYTLHKVDEKLIKKGKLSDV